MQKDEIQFTEATAEDYDVTFELFSPGHRYQGYGGTFIDYAKRTAEELGITRMGIDFWHFKEPARKCFSRQGFKVLQEIMWRDLSANRGGEDTVRS